MTNAATSPQGPLVNVQQHRDVITDVETSPLPAARPAQHFVTFAAVPDEALAEALYMVWFADPQEYQDGVA